MGELTDIGGAFRYGQIGAGAPRPALVIPLAAATVRPGGVVFTLAAQLLFVEHTTVGMKVALAPMKDRGKEEQAVHTREYFYAEGKYSSFSVVDNWTVRGASSRCGMEMKTFTFFDFKWPTSQRPSMTSSFHSGWKRL